MQCVCGQRTSPLPFSLVTVFVPDIDGIENNVANVFANWNNLFGECNEHV